MPLDRTWYNTLVNDSGSGLDGSIWAKEDVDHFMDAVDAELARLDAVLAGGNIAYTNKNNVFTMPQNIRGTLTIEPWASDPYQAARLNLVEPGQPVNARYWQIHAHLQALRFWPLKDDQSGAMATPALVLSRNGDARIAHELRVDYGIYDRFALYGGTPIGNWVPWVPVITDSDGTGLSAATHGSLFTRIGQTVFFRIYELGIWVPGPTPKLHITFPPSYPAVSDAMDQQFIRLTDPGNWWHAGFVQARSAGYWEVYRLPFEMFSQGGWFVTGSGHYFIP